MNWTQTPPQIKGLYLRVNAGHRVGFETIKQLDGKLKIFWGWGSDQRFIPVSEPRVSKTGWWWFGPIPQPPEEAM